MAPKQSTNLRPNRPKKWPPTNKSASKKCALVCLARTSRTKELVVSTPAESMPGKPRRRLGIRRMLGSISSTAEAYGAAYFHCKSDAKALDEFTHQPSRIDRKYTAWLQERRTQMLMPEDVAGWTEYANNFVSSSRIVEKQFQRYVGDCIAANTVDDIIYPHPDID